MTAINIFAHHDRVHVLTDGATFGADGTMMGFASKVAIFAHLPAVLAARAPSFFLPLLSARICDAFETFDDLLLEIVERTRRSAELDKPFFDAVANNHRFELYLAGYSKARRRVEAYKVCNFPQPGRDPWSLTEIPGIVSPADAAFAERVGEIELNLLSADMGPGPRRAHAPA